MAHTKWLKKIKVSHELKTVSVTICYARQPLSMSMPSISFAHPLAPPHPLATFTQIIRSWRVVTPRTKVALQAYVCMHRAIKQACIHEVGMSMTCTQQQAKATSSESPKSLQTGAPKKDLIN